MGGALRPRPAVNDDNRFFFEGLDRGELRIQCCGTCDRLTHPPTPWCPSCGDPEPTSRAMSGRGTVFTYTVTHHPQVEGFDYPLVVAVVELEEGVRLITDLVDIAVEQVCCGLPVELTVRDVGGLTLPLFCPADGGDDAGSTA